MTTTHRECLLCALENTLNYLFTYLLTFLLTYLFTHILRQRCCYYDNRLYLLRSQYSTMKPNIHLNSVSLELHRKAFFG